MAVAEDAEVMIVQSALNEGPSYYSAFILGNVIDLLVLLTGLCPKKITNVYLKPKQNSIANIFGQQLEAYSNMTTSLAPDSVTVCITYKQNNIY